MSDLNESNHSLTLDDLCFNSSADIKNKVPIIRGIFVSYGSTNIVVRADVDDSFSEVMRVVEEKTGIPTDDQILSWNGSGVHIDENKSMRNYGYLCGGFCTLTTASSEDESSY